MVVVLKGPAKTGEGREAQVSTKPRGKLGPPRNGSKQAAPKAKYQRKDDVPLKKKETSFGGEEGVKKKMTEKI